MKPDDAAFVEAILFVAGDGVSVEDLCSWTGLTEQDVDEAIRTLSGEDRGLIARRYGDRVQLVTNPCYADALHRIFAPKTNSRMSESLLETLAIIAYRQPVTRLEIEEIRGVRSAYALSILVDKGLVERVGTRQVLGRPAEYGTTDAFLRQFDLRSLDDLPPVDAPDNPLPTLGV